MFRYPQPKIGSVNAAQNYQQPKQIPRSAEWAHWAGTSIPGIHYPEHNQQRTTRTCGWGYTLQLCLSVWNWLQARRCILFNIHKIVQIPWWCIWGTLSILKTIVLWIPKRVTKGHAFLQKVTFSVVTLWQREEHLDRRSTSNARCGRIQLTTTKVHEQCLQHIMVLIKPSV